ncbi:MAG: amidohydrolase family protein [Oscillospiraceae bacterium]|nr:amidohydrolase family protein [Oscillospiraceae bacterium]
MRFDFEQYTFFDNHTHLLDMQKTQVTVDEFISNYYHGIVPRKAAAGEHLPYQGVVMSLVNLMSRYLDCETDLESVVEARNALTSTPEKLKEYIRKMYADGGIIGTMLDCELPMGHPDTKCFPCETFRLFQYEKPFFKLLETEDNYDDLLQKEMDAVTTAAREGFAGLKGHIAERFGMDVYYVSAEQARGKFAAAKAGDRQAVKEVYFAMFSELLVLCAELDIPVHLHTGSSGMGKFREVYELDPIRMANYLMDERFARTKVIFLHGSYPFIRHSAMMAFNFPNVYMDLSQTIPWDSMTLSNIFEDAIALAPHDKLILGSGQHFYSETSWLAAKTAKNALAWTMDKLVEQNMLNEKQAEKSARMILSENAMRLYRK